MKQSYLCPETEILQLNLDVTLLQSSKYNDVGFDNAISGTIEDFNWGA